MPRPRWGVGALCNFPWMVKESGGYDCKPPMVCPVLNQPESYLTGFDSDLRAHIFSQPSLRHVNYTVSSYSSYAEVIRVT